MTCGECGYTTRDEAGLHRKRRRWKIMLLCTLLFLPQIYSSLQSSYGNRWWAAPIPTSFLLTVLPMTNNMENVFIREIEGRIIKDSLSQDQWQALFEQCIQGDNNARPGTVEWEMKYGRIIHTWFRRRADNPTLTKKALRLPPRFVMAQSGYASAESGICINVNMISWWPEGTISKIKITPMVNDVEFLSKPIVLSRNNQATRPRPFPMFLNSLPEGTKELTFKLEIESDNPELDLAAIKTDQQQITIPVTMSESVKAVLVPYDGSNLDESVRKTLPGVVYRMGNGLRRLGTVQQWDDSLFETTFNNVALGLHAEVLRNGEVKHRLSIWGQVGRLLGNRNRRSGRFQWTYSPDGKSFVDDILNDGAKWELRVKSDPALAQRVTDSLYYWEGEYTVPLSVIDSEENGWVEEWSLLSSPD